MKCEHCTGTVLFEWRNISLTQCDWGCGEYHLEVKIGNTTYTVITFKDFIEQKRLPLKGYIENDDFEMTEDFSYNNETKGGE